MAVVEEQRLNSAVLHCCGPMPPDDDEVQLRDVFSLCPPPQYKPALDIICSREVDLQCFRGLPGNTCYAPERERVGKRTRKELSRVKTKESIPYGTDQHCLFR